MGSCNAQIFAQLAEAACIHAWESHAVRIALVGDANDLAGVDGILDIYRGDRSRSVDQGCDTESLVHCYGALLGSWIHNRLQGRWIGLNEAFAPRMFAKGLIISPLDAVRRRLSQTNAPELSQLMRQLSERMTNDTVESAAVLNMAAWGKRASDRRFANLTPRFMSCEQAIDAIDPWITAEGTLVNRRVLCLAAGGGTHGPLFAFAGAEVVVVDFSLSLLQIDQSIAQHHGLSLRTVHASMDDLSVLEPASFDFVVQPVSTCYVQNLSSVYAQVARVLRSGGLYVSQHKSPGSLQAELRSKENGIMLQVPCISGRAANPVSEDSAFREHGMSETIHSIEDLIGGLCRSGFVIEDVIEPPHADAWAAEGSPEHRAQFVPPYLKIRARRK